tara:strand:+ start:1561 stop:1857 length:297 start_codon:yes stop_codon:yes gene_type:complete
MNITWTDESWEEYEQWQKEDKKVLKKINSLIKDIKRDFFNGITKESLLKQPLFATFGKPEPLKHELTGCWSRRITDEHRLVYEVTKYSVVIISCRYHY